MSDDTRKRAEAIVEDELNGRSNAALTDAIESALRDAEARGMERAAEWAESVGVFPGVVSAIRDNARSIREGKS